MTMAGYPQTKGDTYESPFEAVDPAPSMGGGDLEQLGRVLLDEDTRMFHRMRAAFRIRNMVVEGTDDLERAVELIGRAACEPESALLRHEAAYILGQLQRPEALDWLEKALKDDDSYMVRHEAAEALGNIDDDRVIAMLKWGYENDPDESVVESCEVGLDNLMWLREGHIWDEDAN